MWLLLEFPAIAQECETAAAAVPPIAVEWVAAGTGTHNLEIDLDPTLGVELRFQAALAERTHDWVQGPYLPDASGHLVVAVEPPDAAFLHDMALDYLTVLRVLVVGQRSASIETARRAPPAFLVWPDGGGAPAVVWDRATAASGAPNGVLSAAVRDGFQGLPEDAWIQPPRIDNDSADAE